MSDTPEYQVKYTQQPTAYNPTHTRIVESPSKIDAVCGVVEYLHRQGKCVTLGMDIGVDFAEVKKRVQLDTAAGKPYFIESVEIYDPDYDREQTKVK